MITPFALSAFLSNQGSFPPPALPGFCGSTSPSATLPARPAPHGVPVGVCAPPTGLPVLLPSPSSMRAAATTPAEPADARVARFPAGGSLPRQKGGSASALLVSGPAQRSLALQPAWSLSRPRRPRYIGVLQAMSLPPSPAPIATGWSDSCRAGFAPARRRRLSTARLPTTLRRRGPGRPHRSQAQAETSVLFELISARYERRSLLITANQPFGEWNKVFPDETTAVAAVDRLVHHATILDRMLT